MKVTGSRVAVVGAVCGAAMLATMVLEARQAPPAPAAPGVQAPAAGQARGGQGRGGGRQGGGGGRGGPQNQVADVDDVVQMIVALPDTAPATPAQPRRVLVFARTGPTLTGAGFRHQTIPLLARTIEALGQKTGAWTTVISFDVSDITEANLATFDAIVLASTTGYFLDDTDAAATEARRKAFMGFLTSGKGVVAIHAATDSYHTQSSGGDPAWPEWNKAVGGYFKSHWNFPTQIMIKVEDVDNPINAAFTSVGRGGGARGPNGSTLSVVDEVYTFAMNSWDRKAVRVLTSVDYARMPAEVKAAEPGTKRTDGDYPLSYIHKVGNGRVFVDVLGHDESIFKLRPHLQHILAGVQYAIGDLKADDTPKP